MKYLLKPRRKYGCTFLFIPIALSTNSIDRVGSYMFLCVSLFPRAEIDSAVYQQCEAGWKLGQLFNECLYGARPLTSSVKPA